MKRIVFFMALLSSQVFASELNVYVYSHGLNIKKTIAKSVSTEGHFLVNKKDIYSALVNNESHLEISYKNEKKNKDFLIGGCTNDLANDYCLLAIKAKSKVTQFENKKLNEFVTSQLQANHFIPFEKFRMTWVKGEREKAKQLLSQPNVYALKSFPSFNPGMYYETKLWGTNDRSECREVKTSKEKMVYQCELVTDHTGYEISIEKNSDKAHIANLNDKSIWYKPTVELLPYVDKSRWKKIGLSKEQYKALHMYQKKPYQCVTQLASNKKIDKGQTYCVTSLINNPGLDDVSIQYITQMSPVSEIIHIKAYTKNKHKVAPLFRGARMALEELELVSDKVEINRVPASQK